MNSEEKDEFIIMLLIERLSYKNDEFYEHFNRNYDQEKFNKRYRELLDKFLNPYALIKTEKSD